MPGLLRWETLIAKVLAFAAPELDKRAFDPLLAAILAPFEFARNGVYYATAAAGMERRRVWLEAE